jgi:hypothetical protein
MRDNGSDERREERGEGKEAREKREGYGAGGGQGEWVGG